MIIRKAELKDVETIAKFNIQLAEEIEQKKLDKTIVCEGVKAVLNDSSKGFYFVAEKTNNSSNIIGQLLITFEWSDWRNKYFWWIQSVYVEKRNRKKKIFSQLYQRVIKLAESQKDVFGIRLYVEHTNKSAKQVYETLGMRRASYEMYELDLERLQF